MRKDIWMYDIIGDVHGHADQLEALLARMGYAEVGGVYRHRSGARQALFVGDLIDRGTQIPRTLEIVAAMVAAGTAQAVLGNHEFNAIGYHTRDPETGDWLRSHNAAHGRQHGATLAAFQDISFAPWVEWFRTLPFYLNLGDLRIVHACWDSWAVSTLAAARVRHGGLTAAFMVEALTKSPARNRDLHRAVTWTLKGKEVDLPSGMSFTDHEGKSRHAARVRWFDPPGGHRYGDYLFPARAGMVGMDVTLPADLLADLGMEENGVGYYPVDAPPVFFGHYWLEFEAGPCPLRENVFCLDYGVARHGGGPLCGYQFGRGGGEFVMVT